MDNEHTSPYASIPYVGITTIYNEHTSPYASIPYVGITTIYSGNNVIIVIILF
jgi:hypothetical protein